MPKLYSPEFRRKVLDFVKEGRSIAEVASDLGVTASSIYIWRRQEQIDSGQRPGLSSTDNVELRAARRRISELETEPAVTKRTNELLKEAVHPKGVIRSSR
jgi:transposase-like protein